MPYNKNQFRKVNDKKVLHKVKSHWVAVSLSLLMALGGTAVAGQAVHADNNADLNNQNNVDNQIGASANGGPEIDFDNNVMPAKTASASPASAVETVTPPYVQDAARSIVSNHLLGANDSSGNDLSNVIASLKAKPGVGSSASASNSVSNNVAPSNSKASSSASHQPASSSAASVNYVSGDNGSAASYHAKASADQSLYQMNSSLVSNYVNSINASFGTQTASLNGNYNSWAAKYKQDHSNADVYFKIVNNGNYSQTVSSLAAQHDQNASEYVQSISDQASDFASNVSQGNSLKSQMAVVNSYAQLINNLHSNSGLRVEYKLKEQSAAGAFGIASLASSGAAAVSSAIDQKLSFAGQNSFNATMGSINNYYQNLTSQFNSSRDAATLNSLASQLGYNDNYVARSYVNSFAASNFSGSDNGTMILRGANGIDRYINYGSSAVSNGSDDVYTLLSDTSVMNAYGSKSASYSNVISSAAAVKNSASSSVSSAVSASQSAANQYSAASSAFKRYSTLNNPDLNLANIFGTTVPNANAIANLSSDNIERTAMKVVSSNAQSAINNLISNPVVGQRVASGASSLEPVVNVAASAFFSGEASLHSRADLTSLATDINQDISTAVNDLKTKFADNATLKRAETNGINFNSLAADKLFSGETNPLEKDVIGAWAQSNLSVPADVTKALFYNHGTVFNNLANNIVNSSLGSQIVRMLENANPEVVNNLLNPNSYAAASNAISVYDGNELNNISYNASAISSVANSAASAANSDAAASSNYNASSDVATALAGNLLGNYDNAVYSDQKSLSAAQSSLTSFYDQYAPNYADASAKASSASAAAPADAQLAQAYGIHVYNYAPKYITAIKDTALQSGLNDNADKLATIKSGQDQISVNGVGFDRKGNTYYAVTYNGQNGYVTADPNVTKNTYLFAIPNNNHVTVTFVRGAQEHNSVTFNKKNAVKPVKAGEKLSGVVVSEDGRYGGWTRIRLDDGNYVTANTRYIDVDFNNNNNNSSSNNNSNPVPQQKVNFD